MLEMLLSIVAILLDAAWWLIIIQAVLSWLFAFNVLDRRNDTVMQIVTTLDRMTEPLYRPIRRIMPDFGMIDLSPMVVLLGIIILRGPVLGYIASLG